LPLWDWGYALFQPGRYTIVGAPWMSGYGISPDVKTVRSNRATFTIVP
jgi:hypothetical protein